MVYKILQYNFGSFILSETVSQDQFLCIHYYFYYFRIIMKNLTKCNFLNTLAVAFKKYGEFFIII